MATSSSDAPLRAAQNRRVDWLEERWIGIRRKYSSIPDWLTRLARQLELWVGDELDNEPAYLEVSFGPVPPDAVPVSGESVGWNAFYANALFLRALTATFFVAVDVQKPTSQIAEASVSIFIIPRSTLRTLQATDWTVSATESDTVRLELRYDGTEVPFHIPHADEMFDTTPWLGGDDLRVFRELRDDLWAPSLGPQAVSFRLS